MTLVSCQRKPIHRENSWTMFRRFSSDTLNSDELNQVENNYPLQRDKMLPVTVGSGRPTEWETRPALALMRCFGSFGGGVSFSACVLVAVCRSADAAGRHTDGR